MPAGRFAFRQHKPSEPHHPKSVSNRGNSRRDGSSKKSSLVCLTFPDSPAVGRFSEAHQSHPSNPLPLSPVRERKKKDASACKGKDSISAPRSRPSLPEQFQPVGVWQSLKEVGKAASLSGRATMSSVTGRSNQQKQSQSVQLLHWRAAEDSHNTMTSGVNSRAVVRGKLPKTSRSRTGGQQEASGAT